MQTVSTFSASIPFLKNHRNAEGEKVANGWHFLALPNTDRYMLS